MTARLPSSKTERKRRVRKCSCGCGRLATGGNGVTFWATLDCAVTVAKKRIAKRENESAKAERKAIRARRFELKPIQYWLRRAQKAVNDFVRARDLAAGYGCITCGTHDAEEWHAGHWISVGASSSLRFDTMNIHLQCRQCNYFGAGKATEYELALPGRIGNAEVERLKYAKRERRWTREECQEIEAEYLHKLKLMREGK